MDNLTEKEVLFRLIAGNPVAYKIAERALELEDHAIEEERQGKRQYPWAGFEWFDVQANTVTLNQLVVTGLLVTGGSRGTFKTNNSTTYKLKDPEFTRRCLAELKETKENSGNGEIPSDLFSFIIGLEDIKDVLWRSIRSAHPVHILMVGPPAGSKSMFLGELARLPFSRLTNGGGTSKAGLTDYLLEFHPRYLIIDEIDKMPLSEMSILLSLMETGIVTRLKKKMRESDKMETTVFAAANRNNLIWPELKSRFFTVHLKEYTAADFTMIAESVLVNRERLEPSLAKYIATILTTYTRDVRDAIHIGRLAENEDDVEKLIRLRF